MCCFSIFCSSRLNFVSSLDVPQASEEGVHFIVSRQICLPTPDILQEAPWGMDGPPPYSPVDIEQTLLVSSTRTCTHAHEIRTVRITQKGALFPRLPLPMINIPFKVQMIHGGVIFPSKLSVSFKQYSRQSSSRIHIFFFHRTENVFRVSSALLP